MNSFAYSPVVRQRGAALIVGLMLLVVLTLLAVTGMNTSSTELAMAGNEQYRLKASQASETGAEQGLSVLGTTAGPKAIENASLTVPQTLVSGSTTDRYTITSRYMGQGSTVPNYSIGDYAIHQYEVESTGTSVRGARVRTLQGAFTIQSNTADHDDIAE